MTRLIPAVTLLALLCAPAAAQAQQTFTTLYNTNNQQNGVMFDLEAKNAITIQGFDCNFDANVSTVEIYTKTGTHEGATTDAGQWTLLGSVNITSLGTDQATPIPLAVNQTIAAGSRRAFYITSNGAGSTLYTNGAAGANGPAGTLHSENADLRLYEGTGKAYPFAADFSPRIPNITIRYVPSLPPQAPTISAIASKTMNEDGTLTINFSVADADSAFADLILSASSSDQSKVANGDLVLGGMDGARSITINPMPDANGNVTITITARDEGNRTTMRTFNLTINPVNDAPTFAIAAPAMVLEDSGAASIPSFARMLSAGPPDEASQTLSFTITATRTDLFSVQPALSNAGVLTFTPKPNANGSTQLQIQLKDSGGTTNNGQNTSTTLLGAIEIQPVNDPPVAVADMLSTAEDTGATIAVQTNDEDIDGDPLATLIVMAPAHGVATANVDGTISYLPAMDYNGADSFTYQVRDPDGLTSATVSVTLTITPVNDAPRPGDDMVTVAQNTPKVIDPLANDVDVEGDAMTITAVSTPDHGAVTIAADGKSLTYTPTNLYSGPDQITYTVTDSNGASATGLIGLDVVRMNRAPEFVAPTPMAALTAQEAQQLSFTLAATDADMDPLTYTIDPMPAGATLNATSGAFAWTPTWEQAGPLMLTLRVSDGEAETTLALSIAVSFIDMDMDGLPDTWELTRGLSTSSADSDGDTISDLEEVGPDLQNPRDTDGDNILDALEEDADNDGTPDALEAGDADLATPPLNTDGDDKPDYRDTDSDDDGVPDVRDNCRLVSNFDQRDENNDGLGDVCSMDTDGDGLPDSVEIQRGLNPMSADSDGDTIPDGVEFGPITMPLDTDGDMTIDALDDDSDGDGLLDSEEAGDADLTTPPRDTDNDGKPDYRDTDSDADSVSDDMDNCPFKRNRDQADTDGDGVGDVCSADADGDGVDSAMDNCPDDANPEQTDTDGDGDGDACDLDRDGDTIPNVQDSCPDLASPNQLDTDSDGAGDACDDDDDNDGVADAVDNCPLVNNIDQSDADADGLGDVCDPTPNPPAAEDEGCGCVTVSGQRRALPRVPSLLSALGLLGLLGWRRKRRAC